MTKFRAWKVSELVAALTGQQDKQIVIPAFQRNFVWNQDQRVALIESIRQGFPIGALLLFHVGYNGNQERLQLVDGLQRTVTLHKYFSELFQHFSIADLDGFVSTEAFTEVEEAQSRADFETSVVLWVKSRRSFSASEGYTNVELWLFLRDKGFYSDAGPEPRLMISLQQLLDHIRTRLDISGYEIPVIEFSGSPDDLPAIFDRLNTGGTKLAKYDILAAAWNDRHVSIKSDELIEAVKSKYRELVAIGLEFDKSSGPDFEDYSSADNYLIFEFVFAVGRCLKRRFPKLFGKLSDATTEVESIGFSLVTLCSGLRIAQLGDFANVIGRFAIADVYFDALVESATFVYDALLDVFEFPLDKESPKKLPHSEFQMASLVASVFRLKYDDLLAPSESWSNAAHSISKNIEQHYIYDNLRRFWRGSGDGKAFTFVSAMQILEPVNQTGFSAALDAWFAESLRGRAKDSLTVQRIILKTLLGARVRTYPESGRKFISNLLFSADEMRGSGIVPQNIANVVLTNPDSERRIDPCNLGAKRTAYVSPQDFETVLRERFAAIKSRLLITLYEVNSVELERERLDDSLT